jgi:hypothetical protein
MRLFVAAAAVGVLLAAGCDKLTGSKSAPTTAATPTGDPVVTPGPGGGVVVSGGKAAGGGGSGGAAQAVRKAVKRTATMNDLAQIRVFIENASATTGKMPTVKETYDALKQEAPTIAKLIDEQVIILNPARTREEIWAYEASALTDGGVVLSGSGVERMDAATLKQRLGR